MIGVMTKEVVQMDSMVLVDDDPSDGLEKHKDIPIQQDLDVDDETPIGESTCGRENTEQHVLLG